MTHPASRIPAALATALLPLALLTPSASAQCERADDHALVSSGPALNGYLGWDVAVSGDVLLAGARGEGNLVGGLFEGAVTVWRRSGASWVQEQRLLRPAGMSLGDFGLTLDVDGDVAAVANSTFDGKVALYRFDGSQWNLETVLAGGGSSWDAFGHDVSLSGSTLLVGASGQNPVGAGTTGAGHVFVHTGGTWVFESLLVPPGGEWGEGCGWSVDVDGDVAVLGAMFKSSSRGSAYVFRRSAGVWSFEQELAPPSGVGSEFYGHDVAVQGDLVVAGALNDLTGAVNGGLVRVWRRNAGIWSQEAELRPGDGYNNMRFGAGVALEGGRLVVCASTDSSAYLYEERWGGWRFMTKLTGPNLTGFGATNYRGQVSLSGDRAVLGAPGDTSGPPLSGTVLAYELGSIGPVCNYCTARLDSAGCVPAMVSTGVPSSTAGAGFVVSATGVANGRLGQLIYSTSGPQQLPFVGGYDCVSPPRRKVAPQNSGGSASPVVDCTGSFALDFNAFIPAGNHPLLVAGATVYAQYWYRDTSTATGLTDALQFLLAP